MSSQGPKVSGTVASNGFKLQTISVGATLTAGYRFDPDAIRDAGDWIKYKKQLLVFNEDKTKSFQDPWFVHGNDYRLTWLQGRSKQPNSMSCVPCANGSAFVGNGPF